MKTVQMLQLMKSKFDLILIPKAILIIFILVGLGLIFLLYKTKVSSIAAWVTVVLVTALMVWLYFVFFTGYTPGSSSNTISKPDKSMDKINYSAQGIELLIPAIDTRQFIAWDNIESILYNDRPHHDYDSYSERYTFFLKNPAQVSLTDHASKINRLFGAAGKNKKVIYIDNEGNADFATLKDSLPRYLNANTSLPDSKKGTLLKEGITQTADKKQITQTWKPQNMDYPLRLVYDYKNRPVDQVLIQHQLLAAPTNNNN